MIFLFFLGWFRDPSLGHCAWRSSQCEQQAEEATSGKATSIALNFTFLPAFPRWLRVLTKLLVTAVLPGDSCVVGPVQVKTKERRIYLTVSVHKRLGSP